MHCDAEDLFWVPTSIDPIYVRPHMTVVGIDSSSTGYTQPTCVAFLLLQFCSFFLSFSKSSVSINATQILALTHTQVPYGKRFQSNPSFLQHLKLKKHLNFPEWQWSSQRQGNSSRIDTISRLETRRKAASSRWPSLPTFSTSCHVSSQSFNLGWICEICTKNQNILVIKICWSLMIMQQYYQKLMSSDSSSTQFTNVFFSAKNHSPTWRPGTNIRIMFPSIFRLRCKDDY